MLKYSARYSVGQTIHHKFFEYRGVIVDVDATFQGSEEWYQKVAASKPPKNKPWYRVLVHDGFVETYVAERHLQTDISGEPVSHPDVPLFFDAFEGGVYHLIQLTN